MKKLKNNVLDFIIGGIISLLAVTLLSILFFIKKKEISESEEGEFQEILGV